MIAMVGVEQRRRIDDPFDRLLPGWSGPGRTHDAGRRFSG
jgi:hypothetical protein